MVDALFAPMFAQATPSESFQGGLMSFFTHSNTAEQVIIGALGVASLFAWTIMFGKHYELRRLRLYNFGFQQKLNEQRTLLDLPEGFRVPDRVPYGALFQEAIDAYWRVEAKHGETDERLMAARLEHAENALQRAMAAQTLRYESNMVFLASIVSSAPFSDARARCVGRAAFDGRGPARRNPVVDGVQFPVFARAPAQHRAGKLCQLAGRPH
jgi:hypothetical protein